MNQICQLKFSRACWKSKSITLGVMKRYLSRRIWQVTIERNFYKNELSLSNTKVRRLEDELKNLTTCKVDVVHMALQLFIQAHIGFRAVSRVLRLLSPQLGIRTGPCPQTVNNWVMRLSLVRMQVPLSIEKCQANASSFSNQSIWMIDESIALGPGKILTVLALDLRHHNNAAALTFQDVHCIGVKVEFTWTGEAIADFLQKIIAVLGRPAAYLKDGGTNLSKAVEILGDRGFSSVEIDDISHVVANLLKHEYKEHPQFETFILGKSQRS
jgi:hypothetical protein